MTNEEILENGRNLFQSAENLRQSAPDLDALMASLSDLLSKETFAGGKAKYASREDDSSGNDWIATTYTGNFEVRGQGRGAPRIGTITYVVRLCGNDAPSSQDPTWPWLDQACLFVGWHRNHDYWGPEDFESSSPSRASASTSSMGASRSCTTLVYCAAAVCARSPSRTRRARWSPPRGCP